MMVAAAPHLLVPSTCVQVAAISCNGVLFYLPPCCNHHSLPKINHPVFGNGPSLLGRGSTRSNKHLSASKQEPRLMARGSGHLAANHLLHDG
ncbi:hypothetical protein HDV57DRAFT_326343 [Trichoderma longibrachiatum]